jgi:hypothetical protein
MIIKHIKLKYKKGETYHLDQVYNYMGIFPAMDEYWEQDESFHDYRKGGDSGESVRILKDFQIEIKIKGVKPS